MSKEAVPTMKKILISLLLITLVACTPPNVGPPPRPVIAASQTAIITTEATLPIGDGGLITGQPCQSPCFFGIHVGETPLNQVISSLGNYGISSCSMSSDTTVFCGVEFVSIAIGADPSTLIVDGIQYTPSIPITVEEILKKYGNPSFIYVSSGDIPEAPTISTLLLWDSIRMRVDLPETEEQSHLLENTTRIEWIIFLDETSYTSLTASGYAQPWKGYGSYEP
jgi:hypothetical protein